jgi:hypothetical protein
LPFCIERSGADVQAAVDGGYTQRGCDLGVCNPWVPVETEEAAASCWIPETWVLGLVGSLELLALTDTGGGAVRGLETGLERSAFCLRRVLRLRSNSATAACSESAPHGTASKSR